MLVGAITWAPLALAQPTDAERETARSLMDEGDRLAAAADHEGALKRYQAAHEIMAVPTTGIEVARTRAKLGRLVEARAVAIEVANSPVAAREPSVFGDARAEAAKLAEALESRIPSIVVTIEPGGLTNLTAEIEQTRIHQAAFGLPVKINPGDHVLKVSAEGYHPESIPFTVVEGEQRNLALTLTPAPPLAQPSAVEPVSNGLSPAPGTDPDSARASRSYTATYVAFGVAGASALVGGGAGVYSLMKTNDAKKFCDGNSCTEQARGLTQDANTYAWVANIGLGVAVLAAGYGVYTLLSGNETTSTSQSPGSRLVVGLAPSPLLDGAAFSCSGAF